MNFQKWLNLSGEFKLSSDEVQSLNKDLSHISIDDIPKDKYQDLDDYLCFAFLQDTVEDRYKEILQELLEQIRKCLYR